MTRQWQFPARGDPPLLALPQPAAPGAGFESVAPERARRRDALAGFSDAPLLQPYPAPTAGNPVGWEAAAPCRSPKAPTQAGAQEWTLFQPPAPTAGSPLGWEAWGPRKSPKAPTQAGASDAPLAQPPAATAANPLGWAGVFPLGRRPQAPPGFGLGPLDLPPAPPTLAPLGWEGVGPPRARKARTDLGDHAFTLRALPQPVPPEGWGVVATDAGARGRAAASWLGPWAQPQPAAPKATGAWFQRFVVWAHRDR